MKHPTKLSSLRWISALAILALVLSACAPAATAVPSDTPAPTATEIPTALPAPTDTPAPTMAITAAPTIGVTLAATEAIPVTGATATAVPTAMAPTGPATVNVATDATLGKILVDGAGMTLYIFADDTPGVSTCTGNCLKVWPPLLTSGAPIAGTGVDPSKLATIPLSDGTSMVTYGNQPLYYYEKDTKPGDTTGNGVGGVWYILAP